MTKPLKCERCSKFYNPRFRTVQCPHEGRPDEVKRALRIVYAKEAMELTPLLEADELGFPYP